MIIYVRPWMASRNHLLDYQYEKKNKKQNNNDHPHTNVCYVSDVTCNTIPINRRGLMYPGWVWQRHFPQWHLEFTQLSIHTSREIGLLPCLWYKHNACGDLAWLDCRRCHESGKHYNMGVATPLPSCISISYHLHLCSTPYSINLAKKGWIGCGNATSPIYTQKSNKQKKKKKKRSTLTSKVVHLHVDL